jgi:hypothetical protein
MTTARQIEASRKNGALSRGPTSAEGRARSRASSLKHGLAGEGVVLTPEDADLVAQRMIAWRDDFRPVGAQQEWLFEQVVVSSVRIDHCRLLEAALLDDLALRAAVSWDEDRGLAAEETAAGLSKRPALVCRRLRQTAQGCEWLLNRWRILGAIIEEGGSWTEAQTALAGDLLGIDPVLRDTTVVGPGDEAGLVAEQVASLQSYKDRVLDGLDASERESAERGLPLAPSRALERLRRYEAACFRRLQWASKLLPRQSREPVAAEDVTIAPAPPPAPVPSPPPPAPAPAPAPVADPPFVLELSPVLDLLGRGDVSVIDEVLALGRRRKARRGSRRGMAARREQEALKARPPVRPERARMVDGA